MRGLRRWATLLTVLLLAGCGTAHTTWVRADDLRYPFTLAWLVRCAAKRRRSPRLAKLAQRNAELEAQLRDGP